MGYHAAQVSRALQHGGNRYPRQTPRYWGGNSVNHPSNIKSNHNQRTYQYPVAASIDVTTVKLSVYLLPTSSMAGKPRLPKKILNNLETTDLQHGDEFAGSESIVCCMFVFCVPKSSYNFLKCIFIC